MEKIFGKNIKLLTVPFLVLGIIIILIFVSIKIAFGNIVSLNSQISQSKESQINLQKKLNSLENAGGTASDQSALLLSALPGNDSALQAIAQIQILSLQNGLVLSNLNSASQTAPEGTQVNSTNINFNLDGNYQNLANFIQGLNTSLPITKFISIKITNQDISGNSSYRLTTSMASFWAPLPSSIPPIDEPVKNLSQDELDILTEITSRKSLFGSQEATPSSQVTVGKTNPFQ